jgi:hypothetical protein
MPNTRKKPKNILVWQVMTLKRLVKIMLFAKSDGWIHDPPALMALPLGPKNYDGNFFWTPKKE